MTLQVSLALLLALASDVLVLQNPVPPVPSNVHIVETSLFHMRDAVYVGAFRVPSFSNFDYCNCAMAFDPDGNHGAGSLYIATYNHDVNWGGVTELSIPTPVKTTNLNALPIASILQPDTDALESTLYLSRTAGYGAASNILGLQIRGQQLFVNAGANYDADGSQPASFYVRDKNLALTGSVRGPFATTLQYQGNIAGYMADVPPMYRTEVGGDTISGLWSQSIVTRMSAGPAAFAYNTAQIGPMPFTPNKLIFYPPWNQLGFYTQSGGGCGHEATPPCLENGDVQLDFNPGVSGHEGAMMAAGYRSILFVGGLGVGPYCYGTGTTDPALDMTPNGDGDIFCYDLEEYAHGTHAYPYRMYFWLYRLDDALKVKSGQLADYDAYPYEFGDLGQFIPGWMNFYQGKQGIKGAAWDESRRMLYVAADKQDGATVLIHAFRIPQRSS